jgi:hypothetical protein
MRWLIVSMGLGVLLVTASAGGTQTTETQNKLDQAVAKEKEKAAEDQKADKGKKGVKRTSQLDQDAAKDFRARDRNGDGFLNQDEMPDQLKAELGKWDTNRDNLISLDEYKLFYASQMQRRRAANEMPLTPAPLEDLLAQALRDNPDIRVAESKVREAEAELNRARLAVTQKVVAHQRDLAEQQALIDLANAKLARLRQLHKTGNLSAHELEAAEANLQKAKADLARVEADLNFLLGANAWMTYWLRSTSRELVVSPLDLVRQSRITKPEASADKAKQDFQLFREEAALAKALEERAQWRIAHIVKPAESRLPAAMADNIRKALNTPTPSDYSFTQSTPKQILDSLQQYCKGFNVVVQVAMDKAAPVTLHLKEPVPVGAVFQFLEDQYHWRFVVREYGIVIADPGRVPPGAVNLQDIWRDRPIAPLHFPGPSSSRGQN